MKATLTFDTDEEGSTFMVALHGREVYMTLSDVQSQLRTHLKHGDDAANSRQVMESVYREVCNILGRIEE